MFASPSPFPSFPTPSPKSVTHPAPCLCLLPPPKNTHTAQGPAPGFGKSLASSAPKAALPKNWEYEDPLRDVHGPFDASQVISWYTQVRACLWVWVGVLRGGVEWLRGLSVLTFVWREQRWLLCVRSRWRGGGAGMSFGAPHTHAAKHEHTGCR